MMLLSFAVHAQIPAEYTKLFEADQFQEAIEFLSKADEKLFEPGQKDFLLGKCYSRLRKYDEASIHFKNASKKNEINPELNYEHGQALYAANKLKQARYEFSKSAGKKFNYTPSVYYVAYISELLEDDVAAKASYRKLIKDGRTDKKFMQIALFQYAKILLRMMQKEEESSKTVERNLVRLDINLLNTIPRYIFPLLRKALDIDRTSEVGAEIEKFISNLLEEYKLDPNILVNGRRISPDKFYANIAQRLKYDNNVALTKNASALNETEAFLKYDFILDKKIVSTPELRLNYAKYKDQETPDVFENDSLTMSYALRNKFEHSYKDLPASFLADVEYTSLNKDWRMVHKREYFSKTLTFSIGEQVSFSNTGYTYFRMRHASYNDESEVANSKTLSFNADHYLFLKEGQHLVIATVDFSQVNYYEYQTLSYNTYLARIIYLVFEIFPSYTLQMIFSSTLTDPKEQKESRGYEFNLNPSIDISKAFTDRIRLSVNFNYSQTSSKDSAYRYHRRIVGTELSFTF
ncbi:MAG: hypothetical protein WC635_10405 [Bacteriovorax sp.]|jgi:hypothetical protein